MPTSVGGKGSPDSEIAASRRARGREMNDRNETAPTDAIESARRDQREAERLVRSGRLDQDTVRELEIAIDQLRADLTNGESPDASLGRIRRLIDRSA